MSRQRAGRHSSVVLVAAPTSPPDRLADGGGDVGGLGFAQVAGSPACRVRAASPTKATAGPAGGPAPAVETAARTRAGTPALLGDEPAERVVDPVEDGATVRKLLVSCSTVRRPCRGPAGTWRCRPGGSGRSTASGRRRRTAPGVDRRPPTTVLVAGVGVGRGDEHGQLDLDRVGVLELVEQQPLVALAQRGAHAHTVRRVAQHRPGEHEQVVELELAGSPRSSAASTVKRASSSANRSRHGLLDASRDWSQRRLDGLHAASRDRRPLPGQLRLLAAPALKRGASHEQLEAGVVVGGARAALGAHAADAPELDRSLSSSRCSRRPGRRRRRARRSKGRQVERRHLGRPGPGPARPRGPSCAPNCTATSWRWSSRGAGREQQAQRRSSVVVLDDPVDERLPALLEGQLGARSRRARRRGREPGLDRVLGEDPLGEGVQRADGGPVETSRPARHARRRRRAPGARPRIAVGELAGRLLGERDGGDAVGRDAGFDEGDEPVDQTVVLPDRPRPRGTSCRRGRWRSQAAGLVSVGRVIASSTSGSAEPDVAVEDRVEPLALPVAARLGGAQPVGRAVPAVDADVRPESRTAGPGTGRRGCRRRWR